MVVEKDLLPAPFNSAQLLLSLAVFVLSFPYCFFVEAKKDDRQADPETFWRRVCEGVRGLQRIFGGAFGVVVFWVVLGPVAVAGGRGDIVLSGFGYAQYMSYTRVEMKIKLIVAVVKPTRVSSWILQGLLIVVACLCRWVAINCAGLVFDSLWCILVAPCWLLWRWLLPPCRMTSGCMKVQATRSSTTKVDRKLSNRLSPPTIERLLKRGRGGVGAEKLLEFLEGPMNDDDIRQDEKEKKTTVEHIKLLRNRLESKAKDALEGLGKKVASKSEVQELRDRLEKIDSGFGAGAKKYDNRQQQLIRTSCRGVLSCVARELCLSAAGGGLTGMVCGYD